MTVQKCASFCVGYKYMGVEYSSECYCANTIASGAVLATSGCSMACSGDATSLCGGPNRLNFYSSTGDLTSSTTSKSVSSTAKPTSQPSLGPKVVQKAGVFAYQDCYTETPNGRALSDNATTAAKMTVESCATYCTGYTYMATEYGSECYCGNNINTGSSVATSGCSMACSGDGTEICGGPSRLSLYKTKPSGPAIVQQAGTFGYKGCYTEATASRALSEKSSAQGSMSVEQCSVFCSGYKYMGVEYG